MIKPSKPKPQLPPFYLAEHIAWDVPVPSEHHAILAHLVCVVGHNLLRPTADCPLSFPSDAPLSVIEADLMDHGDCPWAYVRTAVGQTFIWHRDMPESDRFGYLVRALPGLKLYAVPIPPISPATSTEPEKPAEPVRPRIIQDVDEGI